MRHPERALLSWSSGKDSAFALHVLRQQQDIEIVGLLTTVSEPYAQVAMHGVRVELLRAQADAAGLPLWEVPRPSPCDNVQYEMRMGAVLERARDEDINAVAFGDLFLADIHRYREERMQGTGIELIFPLWGRPTAALAREMIALGLRARLTCVDPRQFPREFAGRDFDEALLAALPTSVDPCGERGEFHTFTFAEPMLQRTVAIMTGEIVERDSFVCTDLLPVML